ncbi:helix-turn-helix domain-containing protein [Falsibacillus pallidus]|uniref:Tetratricopeptide repeat protein n=1 Tax=Falsibacillus pallidus TaxID=493781 RepID=A0A370GAR8_9BACI|nr:helix-turn-helix domain-containing protein [Falsibacillus pallidus]RDI40149.1 tetratricopeptide repeat protein [Falsibacillus pallidus]
MDFSVIGKKIRELRKLMGLSQEELAEGICTQAQISKIEKGDVYPYASTLYLIAQRLGLDVNYFFDIGTTPRIDYVQEVEEVLGSARRRMSYSEMLEIVKSEEKNPLFTQNKKNQQLLLWHKGIAAYILNKKNRDWSISCLKDAISMTQSSEKVFSEREIEIYLSLGTIYSEEGDFDAALNIYKLAKEHLELLPYVKDVSIKPKLFYNIARAYTRQERFEESIEHCKEAINYCIKKDNLYCLGELHYHLGYNYELENKIMLAIKYFEKALFIFKLQKDEKYIAFISDKIDKLKVVKE